MAEQNTNVNVIDFNGKQLDKAQFAERAKSKVNAWMDYQGLKGDEREAFLEIFNTKMRGLVSPTSNATDSPAESSVVANNPTNKSKRDRKQRPGLNLESNVDTYINGIANAMPTLSTSITSSGKKKWTTNSMAQFVGDSVFGEGNPLTAEQLNTWADDIEGKVAEGATRTTDKRRAFVFGRLLEYKQALLNGEYNISDEARQSEIDKIDKITGGTLKDYQMNMYAPWLSHYLFTDNKYGMTEEEKQRQETARQQQVISAGGNPYAAGSDEYKAREEELKRERLNTAYTNWFNGLSEGTPYIRNLRVYDADEPGNDIITLTDDEKSKLEDYIVQNLDQSFYDKMMTDMSGRFEELDVFNGITNPTKWKESHASTLQDFGDFTKIVGVGSRKVGFLDNYIFSPSRYRQIIYDSVLDKLKESGDLDKFKVGNDYVLVNTMDAQGNVLVYRPNIAQGASLVKTNISAYKSKGSADFWNLVGIQYAKLNGIELSTEQKSSLSLPFNKEGGILKAQYGEALRLKRQQQKDEEEAYLETLSPEELEEYRKQQEIQKANDEKVSQNWQTADTLRVASIAADLASAIAAYAPGYGTGAAAILGVGSTLTNLGADISDKSVTTGQVITNLGTNLVLDLVSLIPGAGTAAGFKKIARSAAKIAPYAIMVWSGIENGKDSIDALNKLLKGESLSRQELKSLEAGFSLLSGGARAHGAHVAKKSLNMPKGSSDEVSFTFKKGDEVVTQNVSKADFDELNTLWRTGSKAQAEAKLKAIAGKDASFVQTTHIDPKVVEGGFVKKKAIEVSNDIAAKRNGDLASGKANPTSEARLAWLREQNKANQELRNKLANSNSVVDRLANKYLATNYEIFAGNSGAFINVPGLRQYRGITASQGQEAAARLKMEEAKLTVNETLNTPFKDTRFDAMQKEHKTNARKNNAGIKSEEKAVAKVEAATKEVEAVVKTLTPAEQTVISHIDDAQLRVNELKSKLNSASEVNKAAIQIDLDKATVDLNNIKKNNKTVLAKYRAYKAANDKLAKHTQAIQDIQAKNQEKVDNFNSSKKSYDQYKKDSAIMRAYQNRVANGGNTKYTAAEKEAVARLTDQKKFTASTPLGYGKAAQTVIPDIDPKSPGFAKLIEDFKTTGLSDFEIRQRVTSPEYISKFRELYKFKQGGLIKFLNDGGSTPTTPVAPNDKVKVVVDPTTGATHVYLINPETKENKPTSATTPAESSVSSGYEWTDATNQESKDSKNPSGVDPSDFANTLLELGKYGNTRVSNAAIADINKNIIPLLKDPLIKQYKVWSTKPMLDAAQRVRTEYGHTGAMLARGTSDLGAAAAYQLTAQKAGESAALPYETKAHESLIASVNKSMDTTNENMKSYHDTGEDNKAAIVAKKNHDLMVDASKLSKDATQTNQLLTAMQNGIATSAAVKQQREFNYAMLNDPDLKNAQAKITSLRKAASDAYNALEADPENEDKQTAYTNASTAYENAKSEFTTLKSNKYNEWQRTHVGGPVGVPFTIPFSYSTPRQTTFDFGDSFEFKRGGKLEESGLNLRHFSRLYHDTQKTYLTESNKKEKLVGNGLAYFRKIMMQGRG